MDNIALLSFNNYFNRKYKKYANLSEYEPYILEIKNGVNFNPNDGVTTSLVVNTTTEPNYLIVTKGAGNIIGSRWFVIEQRRNRQGQYTLTLRRDVVADCIQDPSKVTVFADRGYVPNTSAFIFNSEGNSYNQIKKKESILKDESKSPWLVGYLASNVFTDGDKTIEVQTDATAYYDNTYATVDDMIADNPLTALVPTTYLLDPIITELNFFANITTTNLTNLWWLKYNFQYVDIIRNQPMTEPPPNISISNGNEAKATVRLTELLIGDEQRKALSEYIAADQSDEILNTEAMIGLLNKEGKVARVGNPNTGYVYYKLILTPGSDVGKIYGISSGTTKTYIDSKIIKLIQEGIATGSVPASYTLELTASSYTVAWQQIDVAKTTITLKQDAPVVDKSPYYCFAIPYNSIAIKNGALMVNTSASSSRRLARQIATQLSSFCYDIQLLPYFPLQSYIDGTATINITNMSKSQYNILSQGTSGGLQSVLFWINEPNFSFTIEDSIVYNSKEPKIQNETQFCRLNSPNYSASFDFSVAKNKGVAYWQVDCSYKPYQPYIHVAPNWKGLYGSNFNDARGLICTGDFSIDLMTDKWQEYQVQNKNYNEIFNRQIQTLDLQQSIASTNEKWQVGLGAISSALQGAASGSALGSYGAIGAAAIGGIGSAIAGAVDMELNQKLRDDARSSAYDMLNFQLGNIKALPNTLTKVSTYNINNKIYPFYEIYEATSEEIENLRLQLKLRGYNLGISGILSTFMVEGKYFKGKIIYNEDVIGDSHMAEVLNSELTTGIYF